MGMAEREANAGAGEITRELMGMELPSLSEPGAVVPQSPAAAELAGVVLENLAFENRLGAGGMGEVWRARDTELDIPVAVKILPPHLAGDAQFVIRFLREARAVARLDHPNIVRVYQAGRREFKGSYLRVMVMELVEGHDAQHALADGPMQVRNAAEIVLGAARALRYAHARGVIHRDIKPANLLLPARGDGAVVKVLDFGLATLATADPGVTSESAVIGTPYYMPPEQAQGKPVDARADVYALGITLYQMVSGRVPFDGDLFSILKGHVEQPLEFPPDAFAPLPAVFRQVVECMCAKAPGDRRPATPAPPP
jgi:serine/threonine-protein kinase